jgi:hypothetical protein
MAMPNPIAVYSLLKLQEKHLVFRREIRVGKNKPFRKAPESAESFTLYANGL